MDVYENLNRLNLALPEAPKKGGVYSPAKRFGGGLIYISGCGPSISTDIITGKLGKEYTTEEAQPFARNCMLNVLAVLQDAIGDLRKVKNCVKLLVLVAGTDEFYSQPLVANGASELLVELFGEEIGAPTRSAIGVNALPGNIPVEVEAIFEIEE